ncbi:LOW QUALITY PROTEIN: hypothetical protein MAR_028008 [Mya arenaria]|uniref:Uncharacterized protein n=1 Tax=Mya arenaria TaxID=6604 RepID=A0ABY7DEG5_MYAAR|nr:LOW QUALITY PROTEIN: hypothetical protein MAR_028008 [Mya arenaria]
MLSAKAYGPTTRDTGCQTEDVMATETSTSTVYQQIMNTFQKQDLHQAKLKDWKLQYQKAEIEEMSHDIQELSEILTDYESHSYTLRFSH